MRRTYQSPVGSRNLKSYADEPLQEAMNIVLQQLLSQRKVSEEYSIRFKEIL